MRFLELQYFKTICDCNNMSRAAEILHVSQPALSKSIKRLEEDYSVSLFVRNGKNLQLTEAGICLYSQAQNVLSAMDNLETTMKERLGQFNQVRLGINQQFSNYILLRILPDLCKKYPAIQLHSRISGVKILYNLLLQGKLDIAIVLKNVHWDESNNPDAALLYESQWYYCVCWDNPLAVRKAIDLETISHLPLGVMDNSGLCNNSLIKRLTKFNPSLNVVLASSQTDLLVRFTKMGLFNTILTREDLEQYPELVGIEVPELNKIRVYLLKRPGLDQDKNGMLVYRYLLNYPWREQ